MTEAVGVGALDDGTGGEPCTEAIVQLALKLLADTGAGGHEAIILNLLRGFGVVGGREDGRVVPRSVEAHHDGGETEARSAEARDDGSGLEGGRIVDVDAVVMRVQGLDEVGVELTMNKTNIILLVTSSSDDTIIDSNIILDLAAHPTRNNRPAEMQKDQTGTRELRLPSGKDLVERALMVIEAQISDVVLAADVDDGVARLETGRIASADQRRVAVLREHAQHVDGQRLVGVEVFRHGSQKAATEHECEARRCE
ncbi:hypothetical protein CP533_5763 [Ophiocordyceps camponoti-saundersi (nom. inval.)]|nr:hypothetical protein CP533_5763 [Ophiocordyceps camponoti-saundersi (nom. inval.)]